YSSVATHGETLVRALLADGGFNVVYRPHPLTGVTSADYANADARIRKLIETAATAQPASHRVDSEDTLVQAFADADVLVCDVSAVALNWLPTNRPLIVARPMATVGYVPDPVFAAVVPEITAEQASDAPRLVRESTATWDRSSQAIVEHYFTS